MVGIEREGRLSRRELHLHSSPSVDWILLLCILPFHQLLPAQLNAIRDDWEERSCVDALFSWIEIVEASGIEAKGGQRKTMVCCRKGFD